MDFEELLLEEIIDIVKDSKNENHMRYDLKCLLKTRLCEFLDNLDADKYPDYIEQKIDQNYHYGYDMGWDDAREEILTLIENMRRV